MDRGERLIKGRDSWFSAKPIEVGPIVAKVIGRARFLGRRVKAYG